ncbi:MAG: hypothetical protein MOB07_20160 [Acidobacteria bacterium]|nr:hypothetical protein [Acidobacteriota bacterium]
MGGRKSDKSYTNEAWTKRVDREAGRHRTVRAPAEPLVCEVCGDVYSDRRWTPRPAAKARRKPTTIEYGVREWVAIEGKGKKKSRSRSHDPKAVVCPACQRQRDGAPSGFVHLDGAYLNEHSEEIRHFLQREAERAAEDNPLAKIMRWETDEKGRPTLATTTEHLAQRLGKALKKSFKGETHYDFSHENKLAHVYWRRD